MKGKGRIPDDPKDRSKLKSNNVFLLQVVQVIQHSVPGLVEVNRTGDGLQGQENSALETSTNTKRFNVARQQVCTIQRFTQRIDDNMIIR